MKTIPEEEKSDSTLETDAPKQKVGSPLDPMSKPATIQTRTNSMSTASSIRLFSASVSPVSTRASTSTARISPSSLDPIAGQKSLQFELQQWKELYHKEQRQLQRRIDTLEVENIDLLQEQDILNDRHQSHTEELRYMQNEFLCIKGHLLKLRNDMESLDGLLLSQQQKQRQQQKRSREETDLAEKVEGAIFKLKERQEFTCVFMENTISSIDEILNEYIPEKPEYTLVEDHKTSEEVIQEVKARELQQEEEEREPRRLVKGLSEQEKDAQLDEEEEGELGVFSNSLNSSLAFQFPEVQPELGIVTPAMKEAKLNEETLNLFMEQQQMFAKYMEESRSDQTTSENRSGTNKRFKGWFEEKRDNWREEESLRELRHKKRQSQSVMLGKVTQMHSNAFQKVTKMKLDHDEQVEEDRKGRQPSVLKMVLKMVGVEEGGSSWDAKDSSQSDKPSEKEIQDKLEEQMRISLTEANLNDVFKQYQHQSQRMGMGKWDT